MNTKKQYAIFQQKLQKLSGWKLSAAATAVTERSWPNYALFAELTEFGEPAEVRHCLNMLWDHIAGHQSAKNFERLLEKLEPNVPDLEEFDVFGAVPAHDAIVSLICAVNCAMTPSIDEVASALTLSLSTVGKFIKYTEAEGLKGTELSQYVEQSELYVQQQAFIEEVLSMLEQQGKQNSEFMKKLKILSVNDGVSPLGISLE